jgi:hypothetical protein
MNSSQQLTVDEVILSSAPLSLSSLTLIDTCWQQINIKNFSTAQCFLLSHSQSRHNFSLTEIISLFFSHNVVFHLHKYNVIFYISLFSLSPNTRRELQPREFQPTTYHGLGAGIHGVAIHGVEREGVGGRGEKVGFCF